MSKENEQKIKEVMSDYKTGKVSATLALSLIDFIIDNQEES